MFTKTEQETALLSDHYRSTLSWFDPRKRRLGMVAFILNRITAIGLVFYLAIHLLVLSLLAIGEATWDAFIAIVRSPIVLGLDVVLIAAVLIHGLNGLRLTLVGLGIAVKWQKSMFVLLLILVLGILIAAAVGVFMV